MNSVQRSTGPMLVGSRLPMRDRSVRAADSPVRDPGNPRCPVAGSGLGLSWWADGGEQSLGNGGEVRR